MIDLKLSKKNAEKQKEVAPSSDGPDYPWGTELRFETDIIKKLGIGKLEAGEKVNIKAVGKVVNVNTMERDNSKATKSLEIQIQKIEIKSQEDAETAFNE